MLSRKNIHISQRLTFLLFLAVLAFLSIGIIYTIQQATQSNIRAEKNRTGKDIYLLSNIHLELMNLNKVLLEQFSSEVVGPSDRLLGLQASLSKNVLALKTGSQDPELVSQITNIDGLLNDFDVVYNKMHEQYEVLGENAKNGLLLELAIAAEQFETVLLELNSKEVNSALLSMRADEKHLVEEPSTLLLSAIDEKIYNLISVLSGLRLQAEESDFVMSALEEYSKKLEQLVAVVENITTREQDLIRISEKLTAETSVARVHAREYAEQVESKIDTHQGLMATVFTSVLALFTLIIVFTILSFRSAILTPLAKMNRVISRVNDGDLKQRLDATFTNEFGEFAQSFNVFMNKFSANQQTLATTLERQNNEIQALAHTVEVSAQDKKLLGNLASPSAVVGDLAQAINTMNEVVFQDLLQAKTSSEKVGSASLSLQEQTVQIDQLSNEARKHILSMCKALHLSLESIRGLSHRSSQADAMVEEIVSSSKSFKTLAQQSVNSLIATNESVAEVEKSIESMSNLSGNIQNAMKAVNSIADRSHILALNASMATAEHSKDHSVVIDDVQQLSNHARDACGEVSRVIGNTQDIILGIAGVMKDLLDNVKLGTELAVQVNTAAENRDEAVQQLEVLLRAVSSGTDKHSSLIEKIFHRSKIVRAHIEKTHTEVQTQKQYSAKLLQLILELKQYLDAFQWVSETPAQSGDTGSMGVEYIDEKYESERDNFGFSRSGKKLEAEEEEFAL